MRKKLFISWSGEFSKRVAGLIEQFINDNLKFLDLNTFYSVNSIDLGTAWSQAVERSLDEADISIIVVTDSNVENPWLNYELGALLRNGNVFPLWLGENTKSNKLKIPDTINRLQYCELSEIKKIFISVIKAALKNSGLEQKSESCLNQFENQWKNVPPSGSDAKGDKLIKEIQAAKVTYEVDEIFVRQRHIKLDNVLAIFQGNPIKRVILDDILNGEMNRWAHGEIFPNGEMYESILYNVYRIAEHSVFSTSNEAYMDVWFRTSSLGQLLLIAHEESFAKDITRLFILENEKSLETTLTAPNGEGGVEKETIRDILNRHLSANIKVRVIYKNENNLKHIFHANSDDFSLVDNTALAVTGSFNTDSLAAKWYIKNDSNCTMFDTYQKIKGSLIDVSKVYLPA